MDNKDHKERTEREIWRLIKYHMDTKMTHDDMCAFIADGMTEVVGQAAHEGIKARMAAVMAYREKLRGLLAMPQVAQRSDEWYAMRRDRLTASDIAQAMDRGKFGTRQQLLEKKAFPDLFPFNGDNPALKWGVMFEPIAARTYTQRNGDIRIHDFGLVAHPTLACFGASPDGISELGIMVEFKCPFRRKIDGTIPEQYLLQMQGQLAVCGLEECDYVECALQKLWNMDEYVELIPREMKKDHGIILEYEKSAANPCTSYKYSPEYLTPGQAIEWMRDRKSVV